MSRAKSFPITVHFTDEDGAAIQGLALLSDKSASEYLRDMALSDLEAKKSYNDKLTRILKGRKEPEERGLSNN
jgi:hypothetical protein